jgi:hypothetical protein
LKASSLVAPEDAGAILDRNTGLLADRFGGMNWQGILQYKSAEGTEKLEGLLSLNNYSYTVGYTTDISRTPATEDASYGRVWFASEHVDGDSVFIEKRAGGSGVSRWHKPPSMSKGAIRINARGEAITRGRTNVIPPLLPVPPKIWRNGTYTPINDLVSKPESSSLNITKLIDLASNGIILAQATENGVTKTGLLLPVEVSWKAIAGFENVDDHTDPWDNSGIRGNRIFPGYKNPDDTEIRHKLELIVKTSPLLEGKMVFVKAFDVDDSTSEAFDADEVIDSHDKAGDDNLVDYLGTPKGGQFWTGSAWGGQTGEGTVDSNGETKFIFRVGMQPGNNYRVVASVIEETMYDGVQTTDPASPKYLGSETAPNDYLAWHGSFQLAMGAFWEEGWDIGGARIDPMKQASSARRA